MESDKFGNYLSNKLKEYNWNVSSPSWKIYLLVSLRKNMLLEGVTKVLTLSTDVLVMALRVGSDPKWTP